MPTTLYKHGLGQTLILCTEGIQMCSPKIEVNSYYRRALKYKMVIPTIALNILVIIISNATHKKIIVILTFFFLKTCSLKC